VQLSNACYTELPVLENTQIILEVTNDFGCSARDSIEVFLFQSPNAVSISQAGDYLICTEIGTYSWYLDGVLLVEETNDTLAIQSEGSYNLVLNADGPCALQSNSIDIVFTNMESTIQSAPKLVRVAELTYRLEASCSNCMYSILSTDGKLISYSEEANETLRFPQAGIYFIEITQNSFRKVYRIGILN
jgi:hypothetical protein